MQSVSTDTLRRGKEAAAWSEVYSSLLAAADIIPEDDDFSAGLSLGRLGQLGLARLSTGRCTIRRTAAHIDDASPRLYSFVVQARGRGSFTQGDAEVVLGPGDITLCDHAQPHSRSLDAGAEMLLVRVPAEIIADYLPHPELLCGRRLPAGEGLTPSAGVMVASLWRRLEEGLPAHYEDSIAHVLLEMIATAYSVAFGGVADGQSSEGARFATIQRYIEDHLRDRGLEPNAIAAAVGVKPQEVRRLFAVRGDSLRTYVLRRRLDEAARRLRDPRWRAHTIAEIAYGWGFNSAARFTHCFRDRFGVSPTEYRRSGAG